MNQVAVNAHVAEPGLDRDGLVRDDPYGASPWRLIHLHREAHRWIDRPDAARLELGDDVCADLVDLVAGPVELEIGDRPRRAAHGLARHADDEAQQRLGPGIVSEGISSRCGSRPGRAISTRPASSAPQSRASCRSRRRSFAEWGGRRAAPKLSYASPSDGLRASSSGTFRRGAGDHGRSTNCDPRPVAIHGIVTCQSIVG